MTMIWIKRGLRRRKTEGVCVKKFSTYFQEINRDLNRIRGLEHLKTETRLRDERFASVMGECVILTQ